MKNTQPQQEAMRNDYTFGVEIEMNQIRYANKLACKRRVFKNQCMRRINKKYPFKVIEFPDKVIEKKCNSWPSADRDEKQEHKKSYRYAAKTVVRFKFYPNKQLMEKRKCTSEHPFGTIKRAMDGGYFLLKRKYKVHGEFGLLALGYNLRIAFNLLGFNTMMALMTG